MGAAAASAGLVSRNPADPGDQIGVFAPAGGIDVDWAVAAALRVAPTYAAVPGQARADALHRAAGRVEAAAADLTDLIRREVGKPVFEARGEVARTAAILRYHAQAALDADGDTYPSADGRSLLMSRRRPRGVVGLITPWNFPHRHPRLEARAGAGLRQRVRLEALAVRAGMCRGAACMPAAGAARAGRRARAGTRRRGRRAGRAPRGRGRLVHRVDRGRGERGADGRRARCCGAVRDGWPERLDRAGRRRPRGGRGDDRVGGDGLCRPEVHRHEPCDLRILGVRAHARRPGGGRDRPRGRGPRRRGLPGGAR